METKTFVTISQEQKLSVQAIHKRANKYRDQLQGHVGVDKRGRKTVDEDGERIILGLNQPHQPGGVQTQLEHVQHQPCGCGEPDWFNGQLAMKDEQIRGLMERLKTMHQMLALEQQRSSLLMQRAFDESCSVKPKQTLAVQPAPQPVKLESVKKRKNLYQRIRSLFF